MAEALYGITHLKLAPAAETDLSGYYQCADTAAGALTVVADSASPGPGEVKIGAVTPYKSQKTLAVGDHVVSVTIGIGDYMDFDNVAGIPTFNVRAIVKDSFSYNDTAPSETNIEIEDSDDFFAIIKTDNGTEGFTLQTYDMSREAFEYLMGYKVNGDWNEEQVSFQMDNQCVEIKTKRLKSNPARVMQWARMNIKVNRNGTVGKSGFPNFNIELTKLANYDKDGREISGARWKKA